LDVVERFDASVEPLSIIVILTGSEESLIISSDSAENDNQRCFASLNMTSWYCNASILQRFNVQPWSEVYSFPNGEVRQLLVHGER
jgi:hypothetical protein